MSHKRVRTATLFCSLDRTPFVAVTAILFALFVFAVVLIVEQPRIGGLNLPTADNSIPVPNANREDATVLTLFRDGKVFWGQDATSVTDLTPKLRERVTRLPEAGIYLNVDADASYRTVSKILDAVRSAGVTNVVFLVEQRRSRTSVADNSPPFGDIVRFWRYLGSMEKADFTLLGLMLMNSGGILCWRLYRYNAARRQTRAFIRDAGPALHDGKFEEVIGIAVRDRRCHVAKIIAEALAAFSLVPPQLTDMEAIAVAQSTFQRGSKLLAARMKVGLNSLVTIASSAPFIGFLGTIFGIMGAFFATSGQRSTVLARLALDMADALMLGVMGLLVAVSAVWSFNYLRSRLETLESEISNAELEVVTCLMAHPQWREGFEHSLATRGIFAVADASSVRTWEVPYDHQRPLLLGMWGCAFYLAYFLIYASPVYR